MPRGFRCLAILLLVPASLLGCARPTPPPGPDAPATQAALASIVQATMTALAPAATPTPTATPTATPTSTATPIPTPAPTATIPPVAVPAGWRTYQSITEAFSLCYPPTWEVSDEGSRDVTFEAPDLGVLRIEVIIDVCGLPRLAGDAHRLNCLVECLADGGSSLESFKLASKNAWDGDYYHGFVIESIAYSSYYETHDYCVDVFVPLAGSQLLHASYRRADAEEIGQEEREQLLTVARSFRSGPDAPWLPSNYPLPLGGDA